MGQGPAEDTPRIGFAYTLGAGAEGCPDAQAVQDAVAARLGYRPFVPHAKRRVVATVNKHEQGLLGAVRLFDGTKLVGEREVVSETSDCFELSKALELAISIAIDPMSVTRPAPPPVPDEEGPPPPPPEAQVEPSRTVAPTTIVIQPRAAGPAPARFVPPVDPDEEGPPPPPPSSTGPEVDVARSTEALSFPWSFSAWAGPTLVYGPTPRLALGGTIGAGVRYRFLSVGLELHRDPPTGMVVMGGAGAVWAERDIAQGMVCGHFSVAFGCGTAAFGVQAISGIGFVDGDVFPFVPYLSAGTRGGVEIPIAPWWPVLDWFFLRIYADLEVPMFQYEAVVGPLDSRVWKTERITLGVGSALVVSVP